MTTTCPPCQSIANDIDDLQGQLQDLGDQLYKGQGDKGEIRAEMRVIAAQIRQKNADLKNCEMANCPPAPPPVIPVTHASLGGAAVLWTDSSFLSQKITPIILEIEFIENSTDEWDLRIFDLSLDFGNGLIVTFQRGQFGSGHYMPPSRSMDLFAPLHVQGIPVIGDVDVTFILNTSSSVSTSSGIIKGEPVDANGVVTLVGSASNIGPFNNNAQLEISGGLSPWPPM